MYSNTTCAKPLAPGSGELLVKDLMTITLSAGWQDIVESVATPVFVQIVAIDNWGTLRSSTESAVQVSGQPSGNCN